MIALIFAAASLVQLSAPRIDGVVERTMARLQLPSVSIAVALDGRLAYVRSYGAARPDARYEIGSISKEFTAVCVLLLQQDGKLQLDTPLARYLPDIPHAGEVSIRQLLTHTAGYPDYYATLSNPDLFQNATLDEIIARYSRAPLDFAPGTQWAYSNTGYAILTKLIEQLTRKSYGAFLDERLFYPLKLRGAIYEKRPLFGAATLYGYDRILLGRQEIAVTEGENWLNGAAGIAMTAEDLVRWDIALMDGKVLRPESWRELVSEQHLTSGVGTGYALGLNVTQINGLTFLSHEGEVQGFTSENAFLPEKRFAVAVLCNQENSAAPGLLAGAIAGTFGFFPRSPDLPAGSVPITPASAGESDPTAMQQVRALFAELRSNGLSANALTPAEAAIATPARLRHLSSALQSFGDPMIFEDLQTEKRAVFTITSVFVAFPRDRALSITIARAPNGKIADLLVEPR
ncbi:MAG: beta-lactamase family protein [Candidatus Eremiobacteraeota bacterium]|nr:beta-lactamase family protein [Candidatus Eremiobacteraeota bacterium]